MIQAGFLIQPIGLGGFQQGKDNRAGVGSCLSVTEQPILSADYNWPDGILHLVIADVNLTVIEKCTKVLLLVEGVYNGFLQLTRRIEYGLQPGVVFIDNGFGKNPALFTAFLVRQSFQLLFYFKESAAILQPFRRQGVLLGCALRGT